MQVDDSIVNSSIINAEVSIGDADVDQHVLEYVVVSRDPH